MDVKLSYNHLREYIDTDKDPYQLAKILTTRGPSIEKLEEFENDTIYNIEVTSNRVDMACVQGLVREALAVLPRIKLLKTFDNKKGNLTETITEKYAHLPRISFITAEDASLFSRMLAIEMSIESVGISDRKIKETLERCDFNTINSVVDISNYVLLETGMPSHIFDADKIRDGITLTKSKAGEEFIALNNQAYTLQESDIIFKNKRGEIIDLCGVMGGKNSEVDNETKNILILVPLFDKKLVRRASLRYQLRTVASTYFEKDLDSNGPEKALNIIIDNLQKLEGKVVSQLLTFGEIATYTNLKRIGMIYEDILNVMGITQQQLDKDRVIYILASLGFGIITSGESILSVSVPSWRDSDVFDVNDIVEEVARIYGYENLPNILQDKKDIKNGKKSWGVYGNSGEFEKHASIKNTLKEQGFNEVLNYPFFSLEYAKLLNIDIDTAHKVKDSFNSEFVIMRESLLPSLLQTALTNKGKEKSMAIFELGKVFKKQVGSSEQEPAQEEFTLALCSTSKKVLTEALTSLLQSLVMNKNTEELIIKSHLYKENCRYDIKHYYLDRLGLQDSLYCAEVSISNLL
jgi:phenylalanyl-tRNA synthetase beta chain